MQLYVKFFCLCCTFLKWQTIKYDKRNTGLASEKFAVLR